MTSVYCMHGGLEATKVKYVRPVIQSKTIFVIQSAVTFDYQKYLRKCFQVFFVGM